MAVLVDRVISRLTLRTVWLAAAILTEYALDLLFRSMTGLCHDVLHVPLWIIDRNRTSVKVRLAIVNLRALPSMQYDSRQQRGGMCREYRPGLRQDTTQQGSNTQEHEDQAQRWRFRVQHFLCRSTQVHRLQDAHVVEQRDGDVHQHDDRQPRPSRI